MATNDRCGSRAGIVGIYRSRINFRAQSRKPPSTFLPGMAGAKCCKLFSYSFIILTRNELINYQRDLFAA